ncbi:hypothetical protein GCM10010234_78630 [Streptomyces hawaiiensis]|uniref:hypothetical protein n=1 Tax=Streptomyces hawaiiensis TaxID=67305 RepID=UPI0031D33169
MDQGLVGIVTGGIAAVAGVGGTAIGALVAAKSARNQVRDQGAVEHAQWLRQGRSSAYQSFMESLYAVDLALGFAVDAAARTDPEGDGREALTAAIAELRRLQWQVITIGPKQMGELAARAYGMAQHSVAAISSAYVHRANESYEVYLNEARDFQQQVLAVRAAFAEEASSVLSSPAPRER